MDPLGAEMGLEPRVRLPVLVITPLGGPQVPQDPVVATPIDTAALFSPESCSTKPLSLYLAPRDAASVGFRGPALGSHPADWLLSSVFIAFLFLSS